MRLSAEQAQFKRWIVSFGGLNLHDIVGLFRKPIHLLCQLDNAKAGPAWLGDAVRKTLF